MVSVYRLDRIPHEDALIDHVGTLIEASACRTRRSAWYVRMDTWRSGAREAAWWH
jgi:hypothetical protein